MNKAKQSSIAALAVGFTGVACVHAGWDFIGIWKRYKGHFETAEKRIEDAQYSDIPE